MPTRVGTRNVRVTDDEVELPGLAAAVAVNGFANVKLAVAAAGPAKLPLIKTAGFVPYPDPPEVR